MPGQHVVFEGSLAKTLRFWSSKLDVWRKSRRKTSFLSIKTYKTSCLKEVSQKSFFFELHAFSFKLTTPCYYLLIVTTTYYCLRLLTTYYYLLLTTYYLLLPPAHYSVLQPARPHPGASERRAVPGAGRKGTCHTSCSLLNTSTRKASPWSIWTPRCSWSGKKGNLSYLLLTTSYFNTQGLILEHLNAAMSLERAEREQTHHQIAGRANQLIGPQGKPYTIHELSKRWRPMMCQIGTSKQHAALWGLPKLPEGGTTGKPYFETLLWFSLAQN